MITMFRVGALVLVVGQACREPSAPVATTAPVLDVPPMEAGVDPSAGTRNGVSFGHPVSRTGRVWRVVVQAQSLSHDPSGDPQVSTYDSSFAVEVVAVDGPAPSRVRLRFLENAESYQGNRKRTILDGKEYFVDARAPHVRDPSNVAAPEAEAQRVLDVFPDLGTRTRIDQIVPIEPMQLGDRRDELAAALLRIVHPRAWTLHAGTASLARVEDGTGVFKVSLDASSESGLFMRLAGEARIALVDAELVEMSLEGDYETKRDAGPPEPPGTILYRRKVTSDPSPRTDR